jgi:hypothetical protein
LRVEKGWSSGGYTRYREMTRLYGVRWTGNSKRENSEEEQTWQNRVKYIGAAAF